VVAASALAGLVEPAALAWAQAALEAPAVPVELAVLVQLAVPAVRVESVELVQLAVPAALAALPDLVLTAELPMSTEM
jgi:hypothetical protein